MTAYPTNQAPQSAQEPAVMEWLGNLGRDVEALGQISSDLLNRLQCVMRPIEPHPTTNLKDAGDLMAPVADTLRAACMRLRDQRGNIEAALKRLEI